jgi:hypothetical protein
MKAYGGVDVYIHIFLTSVLAEGEWSAPHPGRFTPEETALDTHWIGCWVDPRAGLDDIEKRKFLTLPGLKLRSLCRPARSQSLYRLSSDAQCAFSNLLPLNTFPKWMIFRAFGIDTKFPSTPFWSSVIAFIGVLIYANWFAEPTIRSRKCRWTFITHPPALLVGPSCCWRKDWALSLIWRQLISWLATNSLQNSSR